MVRITLKINPGTVTDETVFATPGTWADSNNGRYRYGKPEPIGGWEALHETLISGVCRSSLAWINLLGQTNVAFGTNTHLMVLKAGQLYDITPAGLGSGQIDSIFYDGGYGSGPYGMGGYGVGQTEDLARVWSLATRGEALYASPSGGSIYYWENHPLSPAVILPGAPTAIYGMMVAPTRQVIAFGCEQVDGIYNPMAIRGTTPSDPTDWTPSTADAAFEEILPGGGFIVDIRTFGDGLIVWTNFGMFIGTYVGSETQAWRFDLIAVGCGLAAPQAAIVINQAAYWWTPDFQFFGYQYGGVAAPVPCPIRRDFADNLKADQIAKMVMTSVGEFQEVWTFYPDSRDGDENSRFVAVCLNDNTWFKGDVARTSYIDSSPLAYPMGVDFAGQTYLHEKGNAAGEEALSWFFESSPQYIGEGERRVMLRGVWPDFEAQQGNVSLTIRTRNYPQSSEAVKGPYTLEPGREKKDLRVEGRLVSIRLSGSAAPSFMRLGKPSFDAVTTGER